ncbi:MAG TPA: hypothetical protein PK607_17310, partial [Aggregatilineales bacterium]|nr:hypothetical protein [Aggregatilineales bacterium]
GVEVPLRALFETPHLAGLAEAIDVLRQGRSEMDTISAVLKQIAKLSDDEIRALLEQGEA